MNAGFASKNLTYPLSHFLDVTLVNGKQSLQKYVDLKLVCCLEEEEQLLFTKLTVNAADLVQIKGKQRETLGFIDEKLENLSEANFLLGDFSWMWLFKELEQKICENKIIFILLKKTTGLKDQNIFAVFII